MQTIEIQRRLKALGYDPGPIDGIFGPLTRKAVAAFQKARNLAIKWPGTVGSITTAALNEDIAAKPGWSSSTPMRGPHLPWFDELKRKMGMHEVRHRSTLMAWLRSDSATLGDPSKLPWCGDAVETAIARTLPNEPLPANPYLARNWMKFGVTCRPQLGAVLVFWRGSKGGISGHVGFYAGEDASTFSVLGGNQSNAITIARLDRGRLLGARWPKTIPLVDTGPVASAAGSLSTNEA